MSFPFINTLLIICCAVVMALIYRTLSRVRAEIEEHRERSEKEIEKVLNGNSGKYKQISTGV